MRLRLLQEIHGWFRPDVKCDVPRMLARECKGNLDSPHFKKSPCFVLVEDLGIKSFPVPLNRVGDICHIDGNVIELQRASSFRLKCSQRMMVSAISPNP